MSPEVDLCVSVLQNGGTILYPTDTIWGIGCDATNPVAVERVYRLKLRTETKSMIVLLADPGQLAGFVDPVPEVTRDLMQSIQKPLTIIYPGARNLASNVIAADGSVAIRIVRHAFCRDLITAFGKPVVSTSANLSGMPAPLTFREISTEILSGVDYTVEEGRDTAGEVKPSTIIRITGSGEFEIIRP